MATVTGLTSARMLAIEAASVVSGVVTGDNLILTRFDATTIDAGNVRGPLGNGPIGTIIDYIGVAAPSASWLIMQGQTVALASTLYPDLWAILPATLKSGTSLLMPDMRGKVAVGYNSSDSDFDVIGETGGAKTVTLTQAETPVKSHTHAVSGTSSGMSATHSHAQVGTHASSSDGNHTHVPAGVTQYFRTTMDNGTTGYPYAQDIDGGITAGPMNFATTTNSAGAHTHTTTLSGTTGAASNDHTHTFSVTSAAGSDVAASAHNNLQPFVVTQKLLKVL